jgi:hypothetical protein
MCLAPQSLNPSSSPRRRAPARARARPRRRRRRPLSRFGMEAVCYERDEGRARARARARAGAKHIQTETSKCPRGSRARDLTRGPMMAKMAGACFAGAETPK